MSTIFRFKYRFGLIPSAKKLDAEWKELIEAREELNLIENSAEFKRCLELRTLTASYDFQIQKKEIQNLSFKESEENNLLNELGKLERARLVRDYYRILKSDQLKRFERIKSSSELKNYLQEKEEIDLTPNRTKGDPSFIEYSQLAKNQDIKFYLKFTGSTAYQNYASMKGSYQIERVEELKKITAEPAFIQKVAYLKNKNRYLISDLFQQEKELKDLEGSRIVQKYKALKKSSKLDFFKHWSVIFEEDFKNKHLDKGRWQTENYWGYKLNGKSFSQADEAQCFNGEKNIHLKENTLAILTKAEKLKGQSWNVNIGLVPKEFNYSSGIINSAESFRFREGAVEAKVKFAAAESLTNAFSLTGSMPMPQIDVFRSGKGCVGLGYTSANGNGISKKYKQVYGLDFSQYHIFRLEKFDHTLVWKINGHAVHTEYFTGEETDLFMNFVTSLHEPVNKDLIPHHFEIDWVRCFSKNGGE